MTNVNLPDASVTDNFAGVGVPEENLGFILQRGGEELILEKVSDRFTIRQTVDSDAEIITAGNIPVKFLRRLPKAKLIEYTIAANLLDEAMQAARTNNTVAFASHVYQIKNNPGNFVYLNNEVTLSFAAQVDTATIAAIVAESNLIKIKQIAGIPNTFVFQISKESLENPVKIANRLMRRSEVLAAEPGIIIETQTHYRPKDNLYPQQWYLNSTGGEYISVNSHIDAEKAWDITRGVRSVVVAIADDSVDLNHPDFQGVGKIVAPLDLKDKDFLPLPEEGEDNHGTACAGVAVAEENGYGVVGVAPGCALMPIRTTGFLDDESIEQLFDWAIEKGASVISCSWGPSAVYFPLSLRQSAAMNRAATEGRNGKGCVIVFAAGNANRPISDTVNERDWPNDILSGPTKWLSGFTVHPDAIAVAASTSLSKKAAYSNWGNGISVCAPSNNAPPGIWLQQTGFIMTAPEIQSPTFGVGVFTADRLGAAGYDQSDFTSDFGGTSSATPVVAGVAALVLSINPDLTAGQVKQILQQTTDKIVDSDPDPQLGTQYGSYNANGYSQWFGYGKVNAFKAVQLAQRRLATPIASSKQIQGRNDTSQAIPDWQGSSPPMPAILNFFTNNQAIPGIISAIQINDSSPVRDVQVTVNIEHSFMGDLEINLIAPNGAIVLLQSRTLGNSNKLQATYSLSTTPAFKQVLNLPARGKWQLWVTDLAPGDTGILKGWQLTLSV